MEAALDCADSSRIELAAEVVRSVGELRLRVTGSSMLPAIWPGDVLLIRHCRIEETRQGDIVLFSRHARLFAHRVISRCGACLVTRGDAVAVPDPFVNASELLGKVVRMWRRGKSIEPELTVSGRLTAMLVRRSATVGRLLTRLHGWQQRAGR